MLTWNANIKVFRAQSLLRSLIILQILFKTLIKWAMKACSSSTLKKKRKQIFLESSSDWNKMDDQTGFYRLSSKKE